MLKQLILVIAILTLTLRVNSQNLPDDPVTETVQLNTITTAVPFLLIASLSVFLIL